MWSAPGITPSRVRSSVDRVSTSNAPSDWAARAAFGSSRSRRLRASARSSASVFRGVASAMIVPAILARAAQDHLMRCDRVAAAACYPLDRRLERGVLEWLDLPAVVAHEMVVMV